MKFSSKIQPVIFRKTTYSKLILLMQLQAGAKRYTEAFLWKPRYTNLVRGLGAEAGTLVRTHMNERHPIRIATYDAMKNVAVRPLDRSICGYFFSVGIWKTQSLQQFGLGPTLLNMPLTPLDVTLENWQDSRKLKRICGPYSCRGSSYT